jgi:uncharacterized protein YjbJ (UPF0337 family)
MASHHSPTTKDQMLTETELATYGIPPKRLVEPTTVKTYTNTTRGSDEMMKPSAQDRAEGKIHEVKGKVKEEVGKATDNPDLEDSGNLEKNTGKVQNLIGRVEKAVGE